METLPLTRDLVLIGGGHSHALLLRAWGMSPLPGARLTLVNPGPAAPYTGMLPGFVAGHYGRDDLDIDLVRLARFAGARMIFGTATGIDRAAGEITVDDILLGRRRIGYDVASLDIGIHSVMDDLPGFADNAVPAKPLDLLARRWAAARAGGGPGRIAVIGGGVAGVELALSFAHGSGAPVTIIEAGTALTGVSAGAARALRLALSDRGCTLMENAAVARVDPGAVVLADGRRIESDFVTGAAGARPHGWLKDTSLELTDGFVTVDDTLSSSDPAIFAVGDCAHMPHAPRPKAGVFAVRQAPYLTRNLRAALGAGRPRRYRPQRSYLKLISLGERSALADKGGVAVSGRWLWRWKDRIDRRFMDRLSDLPAMPRPALPASRSGGLDDLTAQIPCGGCAAKASRTTLGAVLSAGDDAAELTGGGLMTADQIRPVCLDQALHARIAAHHAMGDVHAMGGAGEAALALVTLPRLSPRLEARTLAEVDAALKGALGKVPLVGGHTGTGPEAAMGLAILGRAEAPVRLSGAVAGDALLLTGRLGTGIVLAAEMVGRARGAWVLEALTQMSADPRPVARRLIGAHAGTDVTGFGLAGHLWGMLMASDLSARIQLQDLPLLPGVLDLMTEGIRSTAHAQNQQGLAVTGPGTVLAESVYDPQTAGGFLVAMSPQDAGRALDALAADGAAAAVIGRLEDGPPHITLD